MSSEREQIRTGRLTGIDGKEETMSYSQNLRMVFDPDNDENVAQDEYVDQEVDEVAGMDTSRNRKMFETEEYEVGEPLAHQEGVAGEVALAQDVGEVGVAGEVGEVGVAREAGEAQDVDKVGKALDVGEADELRTTREIGKFDPEELRRHKERMKAHGPHPPVKEYVSFDDETVVLIAGVGNLWDAHGVPKGSEEDDDEVLW